ncbi:MAG: hypothetical protein HY305_01950, partial [Sphingobacteriales bacterium]|nr:hypothetical protein [Sphingobacteriales bacterium]
MNKYLLFFGLVLLASCSKKDTPATPTDDTPAQYGTPYTGIPATSDIVMYEVNERA